MPRKFKFCFRCRRTITEPEVQRGLFVQTPNGMLCATCAQQLDEETEAAKQLAAAQAPIPAAPPEPPVEEKLPPSEPAKEEAAPSPIPRLLLREEQPVGAPAPVAPDPPAAPAQPPTPPESTPFGAPQPGGPEAPAEILDSMRQHLEAIHRTLVFEKSSLWNVLATVAQCLAVGMLILGAVNWADKPRTCCSSP